MKGKALLYVSSPQVKNDLLRICVEEGYDFIEVFAEHEFAFKLKLLQGRLDLYVHEFDENDPKTSLDLLKRVGPEEVRTILLIHKYSSKLIDEAIALKVKDIVVLPLDFANLKKKILASTYKPISLPQMPTGETKLKEEGVYDLSRIDYEISRAMRGKYPLSFVLLEHHDLSEEAMGLLLDSLTELLRNTDRILAYSANQTLLICPFTPKVNLVEVEAKVRQAFAILKSHDSSIRKTFLYGVTFPNDGTSQEEMVRALEDGLHDSILLSSLEGPLKKLKQDEIMMRLKRGF